MSDDRIKLWSGIAALFCLVALAAVFGIGHVEEKTSYGLMPIIIALAGFLGSFATWAFGSRHKGDQ